MIYNNLVKIKKEVAKDMTTSFLRRSPNTFTRTKHCLVCVFERVCI